MEHFWRAWNEFKYLLNHGHIYLKRYRVLAIVLISYFIWQTHDLIEWYKLNYQVMQDWQNAPIIGMIITFAGILKLALDNTTHRNNDDDTL